MRFHPGSIAVAAGLVVLATGCGTSEQPAGPESALSALETATPTAAPTTDPVTADATLGAQIAALRRATARFHRPEVAEAAGYDVLVRHPTTGAACLDHPTDGGMGRHYLNPRLAENDDVRVASPEVLIYEPMVNGRLRLVGVEYVVPYAVRGPLESPPRLFGREFLHNPTFGLWMLHVYAWKNNPEGMFATWNPSISCEHDSAID